MYLLVDQLAKALGIPDGTTRAVLTLEVGKIPTIDLTMYVKGSSGGYLIEKSNLADGSVLEQLATVQFMIRLEPYPV